MVRRLSGFDASKFVKREASRPDLSQSVAGTEQEQTRSLLQSAPDKVETSQPFRRKRAKTVAGVATVAALNPDKPFFRELNRMFEGPIPPVFAGGRWRMLCEDLRDFVDKGKLTKGLEAGWELVELIGAPRNPWDKRPGSRYPGLSSDSFIFQLRGRSSGVIEPHRIEILNPPGRSQYCYRAHHMANRVGCDPIWDVFDPKHWPNIGTEARTFR